MGPYETQFKSSAAREFRKLGSEIKISIREAINALKTEPRPIGVKKLTGDSSLYRIRVRDYRIVYEIDDAAQILLVT